MEWIILPVFYLLYWGLCFLLTGTDKKNLLGLRSYPEEVRKIVRENETLKDIVPKEKSPSVIFLSNLFAFALVFFLLGIFLNKALNVSGFVTFFIYFLILGEGLNLFDLLVIDLLWWRNSKRIRFSFLEEKEPYQNPKEHILSFVRGVHTFALVALFSALFSSLL